MGQEPEQGGSDERIVATRGALADAIRSEIMGYFSDPRSAGISLAEFEATHIASGILQRVAG
jgi:hypothetical protein